MCCIFGTYNYNAPCWGSNMYFAYPPRVMHGIYHNQCQNFNWGFGLGVGIGLTHLIGGALNRWC